jgi:hypothetical protein
MTISTILRPNADGSIDGSSGNTLGKINWPSFNPEVYKLVDEAVVNDADYFGIQNGFLDAGSVGEKTFTFPSIVIVRPVLAVVIHYRVRAFSFYVPGTFRSYLITHSTTYLGTEHELLSGSYDFTAWTDFSETYLVNPYTGTAWTQAEINALDAGIKMTATGSEGASGAESDCSWYWIDVITTSPAAGAQIIGL